MSATANAVIGLPVGGQRGGGFRPYFTGGIGMLQTEARTNDDLFALDNSELGFNVGVGAIGFVSNHIGFEESAPLPLLRRPRRRQRVRHWHRQL